MKGKLQLRALSIVAAVNWSEHKNVLKRVG
jgi:hypothetical protein